MNAFTPALGRFAPTRYYDRVIALTRERLWRALTALHVAPRPDDLVVDIGCGTGTLARLLHRLEPRARVVGLDPDPEVLALARRKAPDVEWREGLGDRVADLLGEGVVDTVVSSLVLHQCPLPVKRSVLAAASRALRPGGKLVVTDYGEQRTALMRLAFRVVQLADGKEDTQPNADGALPGLIAEAGFTDVREAEVVQTATGSISIYTAHR
ncbi:class I SAM-dependent methyltransferase [Saccharothrix variisporea]|uniref:Ubiquinone/menaquinone biosynthesis C-methylase UbiE n=1 Tax=Saccharothrix variisporea TaxID=543527 RepID=A0A495X0H8_9PSEU|nr:class I SAM-dependent methyltransferase [Saccharothrix variisporea]RKT67631.1 ubiquinone/menaquinone biosynthesis C-methylase UbiE [Saccharothrix variisporea]